MPLWGNVDRANGFSKPMFANTNNVSSKSTIHGDTANSVYGTVFGVSATEAQKSGNAPVTHAGWVAQKIGTGPVKSITIDLGGEGVNTSGFILLTDNSYHGQGSGANISYSIANSKNLSQASSTNTRLNTVATIVVNDGGSGYSSADDIEVEITGSAIIDPEFTVVLGGRAGRNTYETLVAMGSISGDDPKDNVFFSGV